ncbi:transglutaminase family protein [Phenylobacterium sp.]|uniref:transglutaminase-like domain-containing protein n=1 Tax=Phenylobacterium sp. TaxID=1871053 RepID=UPI002735454A|nr:transglutaminase family protein [Phenylobacterium sp.]MDP3659823.1 transglutaminase family protein [Phenylobacterium sp.]
MRISAGYEITFDCPAPTPMLLQLSVHPSRVGDLETSDVMVTDPMVSVSQYHDLFGNFVSRILAPAGRIVLRNRFVIRDSGAHDAPLPEAGQLPVEDLPDDVVLYLLGSRYCETDQLSNLAWTLFGGVAPGSARVQAILDYVHRHITFGYEHARATKTALEAHEEQFGVCRDFAHLAITLCRCMNIPARYCTGYLGDIGVPISPAPMDFSAWFEVYLDGAWRTCDARHNTPRIGRVLMARGRDATDAAISTAFGTAFLAGFMVITDELPERQSASL